MCLGPKFRQFDNLYAFAHRPRKGGIALTLPTVCIKIGFLSMFIQFLDPSQQVPKIPEHCSRATKPAMLAMLCHQKGS